MTMHILAQELNAQASMSAMIDAFAFIFWSFLAIFCLVFFLKKPKRIVEL